MTPAFYCGILGVHATILHLMGIEHEKLAYRSSGRDFRLTDVYGTWWKRFWLRRRYAVMEGERQYAHFFIGLFRRPPQEFRSVERCTVRSHCIGRATLNKEQNYATRLYGAMFRKPAFLSPR